MMEEEPHLTSPDGSRKRNLPERCPRPLYSQDSAQEEHSTKQQYRNHGLIKEEVKEEAEEVGVWGDGCRAATQNSPTVCTELGNTKMKNVIFDEAEEGRVMIKEEDVSQEISKDGSRKRNPPERCPRPLYSKDSAQEERSTAQGDGLMVVKVEDGEEEDVRGEERGAEEEISPQISTGDNRLAYKLETTEDRALTKEISAGVQNNRIRVGTYPMIPYDTDPKNDETITNPNPPPPAPHSMDLWSEPSIHNDCPPGDFPPVSYILKKKPHSCCECGKCFTTKRDLARHQVIHTGERPYSCPDCGRCFAAIGTLVSHRRLHTGEKPYCCSECGKCCTTKGNLVEHQRTHTGEKPFSCAQCGKCFSKKSNLLNHRKVHTGEKPFSCDECGKCFSDISSLRGHKKIHSGEKPFSCPECGKGFPRQSNLVNHERVHTGEKPFSCPDCGKCFSRNSYLINHKIVHTGEKPFSCTECGKRFFHKPSLQKHEAVHMG